MSSVTVSFVVCHVCVSFVDFVKIRFFLADTLGLFCFIHFCFVSTVRIITENAVRDLYVWFHSDLICFEETSHVYFM